MEELQFHLPVFEGPLELLLHLIAKRKMQITDIQIGELLEQYLAYMEQLQEADLEISSAFLEMAARLVTIREVIGGSGRSTCSIFSTPHNPQLLSDTRLRARANAPSIFSGDKPMRRIQPPALSPLSTQ